MTNDNDTETVEVEQFDPDRENEVGDVRKMDGHLIELHDPLGRGGLAWNCKNCGAWHVSVISFKVECDD